MPEVNELAIETKAPDGETEPARVCRRPQLSRGLGYGHEEGHEQIFV